MQVVLDKKLYSFYIFVVFITLVIPKAGDKIAGIPLTFASLLFGLLLIWSIPVLLKRKIPAIEKYYLFYIFLVFLPWLIFGPGIGGFVRIILPLFVSLVVFYWINPITRNLITNDNRLYQMVKIIAIANIIIALYGFAQKIFGHYQTIIPGITMSYTDAVTPSIFFVKANQIGEAYKVTSTYQNGNIFGTNLVMTMFPVLAAFLYVREIKAKILFGISAALSFAIIPLTWSRAALFGTLTGAGIFFLIQRSKKINRAAIMLMVLLIVAVILASPLTTERMIEKFFDPTLNGRVFLVQDFFDKYITVTSGVFGLWVSPERPRLDNPAENIFNYSSEIMYLTVILWTGIVGLALLIAVAGSPLLKMLKRIRANPPVSLSLGLATGVFAGLTGYLLQAFIEGAFHLLPTAFSFWLLVGLGHVVTEKSLINE